VPARFAVLDNFLPPGLVRDLTRYALAHERDFRVSEVVPAERESVIDDHYRRSRVLMNIGAPEEDIVGRLNACLARVLRRLGRDACPIAHVDVQITASNDGDFFRVHTDSGAGDAASRAVTFVYFFHREPAPFRGGELRIYDSRLEHGEYVSAGGGTSIIPKRNRVVFFPSSLMHEVMPVACPSRAFADSRFTVNGWFCT
jgi:Rps23 Pro-64 3,4-dihydroxylase Tpa1-like proline 4-hydroxylase